MECALRSCVISESCLPIPIIRTECDAAYSTHTAVLFAIIFVFVFTVYATSEKIGSFSAMHALLTKASADQPVAGNAHGSYITMRSRNGLIFGVINVIGNFATVFEDQAVSISPGHASIHGCSYDFDTQYWQRAIASRPASCVKAYLLGGLAWFAIPFMFSTTLGLAAVALRGDPAMRVLTPEDVSAGLPASAAAAAILGKSGAAALLIVLFLAVTSATSAELIAVSSLLTYDVYKVRPRSAVFLCGDHDVDGPGSEIYQPEGDGGADLEGLPCDGLQSQHF